MFTANIYSEIVLKMSSGVEELDQKHALMIENLCFMCLHTGLILRRCTLDEEGIAYWENPTYMKCISNDYRSIQTLVSIKTFFFYTLGSLKSKTTTQRHWLWLFKCVCQGTMVWNLISFYCPSKGYLIKPACSISNVFTKPCHIKQVKWKTQSQGFTKVTKVSIKIRVKSNRSHFFRLDAWTLVQSTAWPCGRWSFGGDDQIEGDIQWWDQLQRWSASHRRCAEEYDRDLQEGILQSQQCRHAGEVIYTW